MSTQHVTFSLDAALYGIDVRHVQEVLPARAATRVPLADRTVAGLVNLRGQVVLALDLRARLGLPPAEATQMLVVVRTSEEPVALLVDRIGDVTDVDLAQFEPPPPTLPEPLRHVITGAYKLENHLLLALDLDEIQRAA